MGLVQGKTEFTRIVEMKIQGFRGGSADLAVGSHSYATAYGHGRIVKVKKGNYVQDELKHQERKRFPEDLDTGHFRGNYNKYL